MNIGCEFLTAFVLVVSALGSAQSLAQSISFTVNGTVKQSACTPNLQRTMVGGNTVDLPEVETDDLNQQGKTWGNTTIHFKAEGCTGNVNNMWIYFTSANVDSNGRIIPNNIPHSGNPLRFEIRNNDPSGPRVKVGSSGSNAGNAPDTSQGTAVSFSGANPLTNPNRVANKYYGIRYYANAAVPAGDYSATVTAHFKYY